MILVDLTNLLQLFFLINKYAGNCLLPASHNIATGGINNKGYKNGRPAYINNMLSAALSGILSVSFSASVPAYSFANLCIWRICLSICLVRK